MPELFEDPLGQIFASKCGSYINQHQRSYVQSDCAEICNIFYTDSDRLANLLTQLCGGGQEERSIIGLKPHFQNGRLECSILSLGH